MLSLLSLLALPLLCASPARAAHWVVTYDASGTDTGTDSFTQQPYNRPWPAGSPSGGGAAPSGYLSTSETLHGDITPVLTWTLDSGETVLPPAPDPAQAVVYVSITATIDGNNGRGTSPQSVSASDSFGNPVVSTTSGTVMTKSIRACDLDKMSNSGGSTQVSLPKITVDASCSTTGPNMGGSTTINLVATPVNIVLGGVTPGGGKNNILVGQGCSGSWTPIQDGGGRVYATLSNYQWTVSGTTFQVWSPTTPGNPNATPPTPPNPNASYFVGGYGDPTKPTANWYWSDLKLAQETVSCTATATPPPGLGAPFTVSSTQKVTVQVPTSTAIGTGGYMQVNASCVGLNGAISLHAGAFPGHRGGMDFHLTVDTPQTPAFGYGMLELVQIVTPNDSYTTTTATNPPSQQHTDPLKNHTGLDGQCPYSGVSTLETNSLDPDDSPNLPLLNTTFSASVAPSFTDYLMYQPPNAGNGVQWVALSTFTWSASGSAQIPTQINPNGDWANFKAEHNGSDSAGGTVSYPNTPTNFTLITVPNTFPSWQEVITARGY